MPACAQTECERLTGTTENRLTECPASAIFIAAASPASPPPTIAILIPFVPAAISVKDSSEQASVFDESGLCVDANSQQHNSNNDAGITGQPLCTLADCYAPVNHKKPDAICEVPDCRNDSDKINGKNPCSRSISCKLAANDLVCLVVMSRNGFVVKPAKRRDFSKDAETK